MCSQRKSNFNQALWLGLSQFCTFALSFISAAILSRYFDKTEYGTYRQILYVYNTLLILFTAGLPSVFSYFIPRFNKGAQKALVSALNKIFVVLGAIFSIILFFSADMLSAILKNPDLAIGLKIFSVFPLFTLPAMGVEGIYTALKETRQIAIYVLVSKLLMLIFIITPVLLFRTTYIGAIVGWGVANFIIFIMAMYMKNKPYVAVHTDFIPNMYKMIFDYSLPLLGAFIAGFTINCADQFFISRYYGTSSFADFSNGNLSIPFALMIANSVKSVLLPVLSKAQKENDLESVLPTYTRAVKKSIKLIIPVISFCIVFGSYLMSFLYSPKYESSTLFFQMHSIRDYIGAIPYLSVLLAFGFSKFYMRIHLLGILFVWGVDAIIVYLFNLPPYYITLTQSILQFIIVISSFGYIYYKVKINFLTSDLIKTYCKILVHSLSLALLIYWAASIFVSPINSTRISFYTLSLSGVIYIFLITLTGKILKINYLEVIALVKQKA